MLSATCVRGPLYWAFRSRRWSSLLGSPVLTLGLASEEVERAAQDTGKLRRKTGSQQGLGLSKAGPVGHLWYNFRRTSEAFLPPSLEFHNPIITTLLSTSHVLGTILQAMRVLNLLNAHKNSRYH